MLEPNEPSSFIVVAILTSSNRSLLRLVSVAKPLRTLRTESPRSLKQNEATGAEFDPPFVVTILHL